MELMKKKKRLTEIETRYFMYQIFSALHYLHKNKIIHRDLKLGNLFLSENMEIKTGDFGLATVVNYDGERKRTICGTPNYLAPEILKNLGHSYEVDIWSCGVIMYTMLVGVPPFETNDVKTTYKRIKSNLYKFPSSVPMSDIAKNFIKKMLNPEPLKRPSVRDALMDDFFINRDYCMQSASVCPESLTDCIPDMCGNATLKRRKMATMENDNVVEKKFGVAATPRLPLRPLSQNTVNRPQYTDADYMTTDKKPQPPSVKVSLRTSIGSTVRPGLKRSDSTPSQARFKVFEDPVSATPSAKLGSIGRTKSSPALKTADKKSSEALYEHHYLPIQDGREQMSESVEMVSQSPQLVEDNKDKMEDSDAEQEERELTKMHEKLEESFAAMDKVPKSISPIPSEMMEETGPKFVLRVCGWQDMTQDYGLAYRMSNGMTGAYFNDHTKIVYNHEQGNVDYVIARKDREGYFDEVIGFPHIGKNYPKDLTKKMLLIKYFKHCLDKKDGELAIQSDKLTDGSQPSAASPQSNYYNGAYGSDKPYGYVYVKRWQKTNNSIVFRLTDRTVQVCFVDKTEIILGNEARFVTYIDKQGQVHTRSLEDPELHRWPEVTKRLQYTKDIIYQMIPSNSSARLPL